MKQAEDYAYWCILPDTDDARYKRIIEAINLARVEAFEEAAKIAIGEEVGWHDALCDSDTAYNVACRHIADAIRAKAEEEAKNDKHG